MLNIPVYLISFHLFKRLHQSTSFQLLNCDLVLNPGCLVKVLFHENVIGIVLPLCVNIHIYKALFETSINIKGYAKFTEHAVCFRPSTSEKYMQYLKSMKISLWQDEGPHGPINRISKLLIAMKLNYSLLCLDNLLLCNVHFSAMFIAQWKTSFFSCLLFSTYSFPAVSVLFTPL